MSIIINIVIWVHLFISTEIYTFTVLNSGANVTDFLNNKIESGEEIIDRQKLPTPIDWKPQKNCYFCVDGKLLTVNEKGELVAESGSVNTEPELANRVSTMQIYANSYTY